MLNYFSLYQPHYFTITKKILFLILLSCLIFVSPNLVKSEVYLKKIGNDLEYPWGMDFLDENIILVTQKTGKIIKINLKNEVFEEINGLPDIYFKGPDYKDNTKDHTKKIFKEIKSIYYSNHGVNIAEFR